MASGVDPLDHAIWQRDAEIHLILSFFQYCLFDRPFPFETILWVHPFEPLFPFRRPFSRIEAVNAIPLFGEMHCAAIRYIPGPASSTSQLLSFSQISFGESQRFLRTLAVSNVLGGTEHLPGTARRVYLQIALTVNDPNFAAGTNDPMFYVCAHLTLNGLGCFPEHKLAIFGMDRFPNCRQ